MREVQTRCLEQGLSPPNWRTIKQRLLEIDLRTRAKRRGDVAVLKATEATPGSYTDDGKDSVHAFTQVWP